MICIIDYGMGNVGSIVNMFKKIGIKSVVSSDPNIINQADKLVLPGVGAFDRGMQNLIDRGLIDLLNTRVLKENVPILGLCLGMQLFTRSSEEGSSSGLGWVDAKTVRFIFPQGDNKSLKVPHMGWNTIKICKQHSLFSNYAEPPRFYFVHSYYVQCAIQETILATSHYGIEFASMIIQDNIIGAQFHPEKSHSFGMRLLKNFAELDVHG